MLIGLKINVISELLDLVLDTVGIPSDTPIQWNMTGN